MTRARAAFAWLALAGAAAAMPVAQDETAHVVEPRAWPVQDGIRIDGDLEDWERRDPLRIDAPWQRNLSGHGTLSRDWEGPSDASLVLHLAYDRTFLYLGGVVLDDDRVHDDRVWWDGDCIELFLHVAAGEDDVVAGRPGAEPIAAAPDPLAWGENDVQICLMPYNAGRPWGVAKLGRAFVLSDGGLEGVEVAAVPLDGPVPPDAEVHPAGYAFEARIPFANFPGFAPRTGSATINVALNDHDDLPGRGARESYLTLNGAAALFLGSKDFLPLAFEGEPPPEANTSRGWGHVQAWLLSALGALALLALVAFGSRGVFEWVDTRLGSWRRVGVWLLVLVPLVVVLVPALARRWLEWRASAAFTPASLSVGRVVADVAEEITRHDGRGFDEPRTLLELLRGRPVQPKPTYDWEGFDLVAPDVRTTGSGAAAVPARTYGIDVPARKRIVFALPKPEVVSRVHLFGSSEFDERLRLAGSTGILEQALSVGLLLVDGTVQSDLFPAADPRLPGGRDVPPSDRFREAWRSADDVVFRYTYDASAARGPLARGVVLTLRDPSVRFRLQGITVQPADRAAPPAAAPTDSDAPPPDEHAADVTGGAGGDGGAADEADDPAQDDASRDDVAGAAHEDVARVPREPAAPRPLLLLRPSLAGPPAQLWDGVPARTRSLGSAGETATIDVGRDLDAAWLFLATTDKRVLDPERRGTAFAHVVLQDGAGGAEAFDLACGVHLGFSPGDPAKRPPGMESEVAYRWTQSDGTALWIEAVALPFTERRRVERLVVEGTGAASFTVYAFTGGVRMEREWEGIGTSFVAGDGQVRLAEDLARELEGTGFVLFDRGEAVAAEFDDPALGPTLLGARLPLGGDAADRSDATGADPWEGTRESHVVTLGGEEYLVRYVPLGRDRRPSVVVAAAHRVEGAGILGRFAERARLFSLLLIVPILLFYVLDAATRIARLRLRLTTLLVATSILPIVLLFSVLYNVVASDRARLRESRALAAANEVQQRFDRLSGQLERTAREILASEAVREARRSRDLPRQRIESYLQEVVALQPVRGVDLAVRLEIETASRQRVLFHDRAEGASMSRFDLAEGGIHDHWDQLVVLAVEARRGDALPARVVVAGVVGPEWVDDASASTASRISLLSTNGWPIAGFGARASHGAGPDGRRFAAERLRESNRSVFHEADGGELTATELLRRADGSPVALVEASIAPDAFLLDVPYVRVPLHTFFFWFCVAGLAAALFMGAVATWRITGPIEALEHAVHRVARGDMDVRVPKDARGEVGRLARSFASMTAQLKERSEERSRIERSMAQLTRTVDLDATAAAALDAFAEWPPAEAAALYRNDVERDRMDLLAGRGAMVPPFAQELSRTPAVHEALTTLQARLLLASEESEWGVRSGRDRGDAASTDRSTLLLPLVLSGKPIGLAILRYGGGTTHEDVQHALPVLQHLAGQVAVSLENARLYRLAVADPVTGLYVEAYFQNRLIEEIDRAQHGNGCVALVRMELDGLARLQRVHGLDAVREALQQAARRIKAEARAMYLVARTENGFWVLMPQAERDEALALARRMQLAVESAGTAGDGAPPRLIFGVAVFPRDGRSAAYLVEASARDLAQARRRSVREALGEPERDNSAPMDVHPFVFRSRTMIRLLRQVERVARSSASVLLLGETGSGKEVIATLLHRWSDRAHRPFVAINCSALPETLLEAELFGYERGAFTGAVQSKPGQLELADGGTVFLDEVGDMPLALQAKLLRVLQDRMVARLGARQPAEVDVRIVAATNRDLGALIEAGSFRKDLYFRLKVVQLTVPPLRERKEDIPALADRVVQQFNEENRRAIQGLTPAALDELYRYEWPGNVRELQNVLQRAMLMTEGEFVLPGALRFETHGALTPVSSRSGSRRSAGPASSSGGGHPDSEDASGLTERQRRLLAFLEAGGVIRSREYFDLVGVSARTGLRDLNDLMEKGLIVRLGRRRAAAYRLAKST